MPIMTIARDVAPNAGVYTDILEVGAATTVQPSVTILTGAADIFLEWSGDRCNWTTIASWTDINVGFSSLAPVSGIVAGFMRFALGIAVGPALVLKLDADVFVPADVAAGPATPAPPI